MTMADFILERHITQKAFLGPAIAALITGIAIVGFRLAAGKYLGFFWPVVASLPLLAVLIYARLARLGTVYRLYSDRLEIVSGLVSRRIESVDLFRVRDLGLKQGMYGRLANFGDLHIHSTDSSAPDLHLNGIDAPEEFYRQMRQLVDASRAQRQTMILEESQTIRE